MTHTPSATIILLSHGPLAKALAESAQMIYGHLDRVLSLCLTEGEDPETYKKEVEIAYSQCGGNAIFLIDIIGGTPFNTVMRLLRNEEPRVVTGMNLPMLLEALALREELSGANLAEALCKSGQAGTINVCMKMREAVN